MKILEQIKEIMVKYDLTVPAPLGDFKNYYIDKNGSNYFKMYPKQKESFCVNRGLEKDTEMISKYKKNISENNYGFALGAPTPVAWVKCLNEILDFIIELDDTFEIQQIKMKMGGVRFYVDSKKIEDIREVERVICDVMFSNYLIY